jgi:hypothetical protein
MTNSTTSTTGSIPLDELAHDVDLLRIIEDQLKRLNGLKNELRGSVQAHLGNCMIGTVNGLAVVEYTNDSRVFISTKLVQERFPDVARQCEDITPVRKFRLLDAA